MEGTTWRSTRQLALNTSEVTAEARRILIENDRGRYTVPTARLYPFQWNWVSMFVALGWAEFDLERAWEEIDTLFEAQGPSGMVPHIVFWTEESTYFPGPDIWRTERSGPASSGISQPPVAATIIRKLIESGGQPSEDRFDAIDHCHRWWHSARDPHGQGVIAVLHPWESGRDNLPDWDRPLAAVDTSAVGEYERRDLDVVDSAMRPHKVDYDRSVALVEYGVGQGWDDDRMAIGSPFRAADPGVSAILLRAERDLAWLGARLGRDVAAIEARIADLEEGFEQFWNLDAGTYCSIDLLTGAHAETGTSASFLAPYAGIDHHLGSGPNGSGPTPPSSFASAACRRAGTQWTDDRSAPPGSAGPPLCGSPGLDADDQLRTSVNLRRVCRTSSASRLSDNGPGDGPLSRPGCVLVDRSTVRPPVATIGP